MRQARRRTDYLNPSKPYDRRDSRVLVVCLAWLVGRPTPAQDVAPSVAERCTAPPLSDTQQGALTARAKHPEGVDARRAEVGLGPMTDAMAEMAGRRCR